MIDIRFQRGVWLPEHTLWLDPQEAQDCAFVSHAHSDHIAPHREVILSPGTSRLMRERMPGERIEQVLEFGRTIHLRGADLTLLPAGHILGSAQLHLQSEKGSLLYTGDFKLRASQSAEPTEWRHAQTLIMETTFGLPRYVFPPAEQILQDIRKFCHEALEDGEVPVLLGYSLGKAQEILVALAADGLPVMLHGAVYNMTRLCREMGGSFPEFERYDAGVVQGKVLICPPGANRSVMLRKIKNRRVAMLSGWAMDPGAKYRYQCDAVFPLSDHADYPDLLRYVELVNPERVLTLHGFATEFARDLRARDIEAWALTAENQLELPISMGSSPGERVFPRTLVETVPPGSFAVFAEICEQIAATTGKKEKIRLLSGFLTTLDPSEAPLAAIFLTGRPFAQSDPRTVQTGWSIIRRAVLLTSGLSETAFRSKTSGLGDIGKAVLLALAGQVAQVSFALADAAKIFEQLQLARGPDTKTTLLRGVLERLSPLEASYLARILTGDLRIGLKEGLVEESLAAAFAVAAGEIREANMLTGDLGEVTRLAQLHSLADARIRFFHPVKVMLASPEPTAGDIWQRIVEMTHAEVPALLVEDKYDGIRAQLHVSPERAELYSRDLRPVTGQFPEIARAALDFGRSLILDGEILAFAEGRKLTFFDLQRRLGRKNHGDLFFSSDIPVVFMIFDLLLLDDESLLKQPLAVRREKLRSLILPPTFHLGGATWVQSSDEIETVFRAARLRGNEGLMIKDPASQYLPGRRGLAWFKLKKELATLDVVVVGAEQGHGKRSDVLSDYTFAVRQEETGELLTIGKAYSGLTDVEIEELTVHFEATTLERRGKYRVVDPQIVLEIAFDSIQASTRHSSGLAMRFPRIKAIRRDKTPVEIDTLTYARSLAGNEKGNPGES